MTPTLVKLYEALIEILDCWQNQLGVDGRNTKLQVRSEMIMTIENLRKTINEIKEND